MTGALYQETLRNHDVGTNLGGKHHSPSLSPKLVDEKICQMGKALLEAMGVKVMPLKER